MSETIRLLIIAGARPNFMKVAPIIHCLHQRSIARVQPELTYSLVHTGQHYDESMSAVFFRELGIPQPNFNMGVGSGTHAVQTAHLMEAFEPICQQEHPDWVVVVGDVNSTMACALVCAKLRIKVAHVEAGLRSFDRGMPEEINRIVTDALSDLLMTPSQDGDENLLREGISPSRIRRVGNVMIDALVANLADARRSAILDCLKLSPKTFAFVTLHRPANVDNKHTLTSVLNELTQIALDVPVVFAMHPRTTKMCKQFGIELNGHHGLRVVDPIGYHNSLRLIESAAFVLTDSGGLQEESTYFRTPCLTLRPSTERPVTITTGSNQLTTLDRLSADIQQALRDKGGRGQVPELWDGKSATRIVDCLINAH